MSTRVSGGSSQVLVVAARTTLTMVWYSLYELEVDKRKFERCSTWPIVGRSEQVCTEHQYRRKNGIEVLLTHLRNSTSMEFTSPCSTYASRVLMVNSSRLNFLERSSADGAGSGIALSHDGSVGTVLLVLAGCSNRTKNSSELLSNQVRST